MGRAIACAYDAKTVSHVICSTDSVSYQALAVEKGATAPFLRPAELATSSASDLQVARHTLDWLADNENFKPDIIAWIRPTAPLRTPDDIDGAVTLLLERNVDVVRSISKSPSHPYWMKNFDSESKEITPFIAGMDESKFTRRQGLPPAFLLNGSVDVFRRGRAYTDALFGGERVCGYEMPAERSVDINSPMDYEICLKLAGMKQNG